MSKSSYEIIQPRNTLREKVGGRMPGIDAAALARAEAALQSLSGEFQGWMEEEVEKLDAARRTAAEARFNAEGLEALFIAAHDAKGVGSTYEYPLVTRIAASLCRMLETPESRAAARRATAVIDAHVDAIRAVVRSGIRVSEHPVGGTLAAELEARASALIASAAPASA